MKTFLATIILIIVTSFCIAQGSLDSGLVAYFPFNGNAIDETGNGYDGTINGNAALVPDRFNSTGKAFTFPDQSSSISLNNSTALNLENGFTINAWIKYKSGGTKIIVCKHVCGFVNGFLFGIDTDGQIQLWLGQSGWSTIRTNQTFFEDQWYMVTATYDAGASAAKVYVDAQIGGSGVIVYNNFSSNPISIGESYQNNCVAGNMNGVVDEVKIYNRPLSDAEILDEYSLTSTGLVAFYPFSGSANDESGNDLHLINSGATLTTDRFGVSNGAYYFSGSSNLSRIDNDLLDLMSDFSVSFWINRPGSIEYKFVMSKHLSGDDFSGSWGIASYAGGNTITFAGTPNWGSGSNPITGVVSENEWHHITFTYDKSTSGWKSFLDGILSNSGTQAFNIQNTDKDFIIGACMPNTSNITASLDDIRIYNRVIDAAEILALFNDSTTFNPPLEDGLVAYWPMNGNTNDSTYNNNDGINQNGVFNKDRYANDLSSIYFDGVDSYVEGINPGNNLPTGSTPRTFCLLGKKQRGSIKQKYFSLWNSQAAPTNYHLFMQDGKYVGIGNGYDFGVVYEVQY